MIHLSVLVVLGTGCLTGCSGGEREAVRAENVAGAPAEPASVASVCRVAATGRPLPEEVRETSGLARSRREAGHFWTHNDAGSGADLFALDTDGRLVRRVRVAGAQAVDWEDLATGPCREGSCLFVGDIGDNDAQRERITIYRVPEPETGSSESATAVALHARFPEGPRDAESLFVLPSGELFVVTKGRRGPITLYRYPAPARPDGTVTLERVRELFPEPGESDDRVTGAGASPDGRWVGIRTYRNLYLYRGDELVGAGGAGAEPTVVDLSPLGQQQGESVAISADGTVWLTSEAESGKAQPSWARLQCTLPTA